MHINPSTETWSKKSLRSLRGRRVKWSEINWRVKNRSFHPKSRHIIPPFILSFLLGSELNDRSRDSMGIISLEVFQVLEGRKCSIIVSRWRVIWSGINGNMGTPSPHGRLNMRLTDQLGKISSTQTWIWTNTCGHTYSFIYKLMRAKCHLANMENTHTFPSTT